MRGQLRWRTENRMAEQTRVLVFLPTQLADSKVRKQRISRRQFYAARKALYERRKHTALDSRIKMSLKRSLGREQVAAARTRKLATRATVAHAGRLRLSLMSLKQCTRAKASQACLQSAQAGTRVCTLRTNTRKIDAFQRSFRGQGKAIKREPWYTHCHAVTNIQRHSYHTWHEKLRPFTSALQALVFAK